MSIFQDPSSLLRQGRKQLQEKAVSQAQQKFMGMVYAAKKGETPASPEVAKAAEGMSKKEARKFAKTKHEGLPTRKEEVEQIDEVAPLVGLGIRAGLAAGTALAGKSVYDSAKGVANKMKERNQKTQKAIEQLRNSYEPEIVNHLIENGFAETEENAINIMNHMSEEWMQSIMERENDEPGESDNNPDVKRHNRAVGYKPRARRPSVSGDPRYGSVSDSEWKRSSYNPANKRRKRY